MGSKINAGCFIHLPAWRLRAGIGVLPKAETRHGGAIRQGIIGRTTSRVTPVQPNSFHPTSATLDVDETVPTRCSSNVDVERKKPSPEEGLRT